MISRVTTLLLFMLSFGTLHAWSEEHSPVGLVWDVRYANHDTGQGHPENATRLNAIEKELRSKGTWKQLKIVEPRLSDDKWILLAHPKSYLDLVKQAHEQKLSRLPTGDTNFSPKSLETSRLAVGGILEACDLVMAKKLSSAFCATRPPGHHAERAKGMGFCVFANVAIAAKYLQEKHGLERILVIDWDVHHGNGTYDVLKNDPKVFQFHVQQAGIYPGTGAATEVGEGEAKGQTINVPLPRGAGKDAFVKAIDEKLIPAMNEFKPQFILISAGFDAHKDDLLGGLQLASEDYAVLTNKIREIADKHCKGRIVSVLEGGYNLQALAESVRLHIEALME